MKLHLNSCVMKLCLNRYVTKIHLNRCVYEISFKQVYIRNVCIWTGVHVKLTTKKLFPPENEKIDLVCIVLQRGENMSGHDLDGTVYFYKWNKRGKPQKFAHIVQGTSGCSSMSAPSGYHITCGKGTSDLKSQKKYYRLWIESLKKEDYTNWYCHHEKTNTTSNHVVLAPFSKLSSISSLLYL